MYFCGNSKRHITGFIEAAASVGGLEVVVANTVVPRGRFGNSHPDCPTVVNNLGQQLSVSQFLHRQDEM